MVIKILPANFCVYYFRIAHRGLHNRWKKWPRQYTFLTMMAVYFAGWASYRVLGWELGYSNNVAPKIGSVCCPVNHDCTVFISSWRNDEHPRSGQWSRWRESSGSDPNQRPIFFPLAQKVEHFLHMVKAKTLSYDSQSTASNQKSKNIALTSLNRNVGSPSSQHVCKGTNLNPTF